jgi:hypothetical protein
MKMVLKSKHGDLKRTINSKYDEKYIRFKSIAMDLSISYLKM